MSDENSTPKNEWAEREIGALWKRESPNQKYLSGKMKMPDGTEQNVVIFTNRHKVEGSNQPDFRVYKDRPRDEVKAPVNQEVEEGVL